MLMQSDYQKPRGDDRRIVERRKHPRAELSSPDRRDADRRTVIDRQKDG